ncbi:MAG: CAP domain-containing protein [Dehalococcoidia bacterium]
MRGRSPAALIAIGTLAVAAAVRADAIDDGDAELAALEESVFGAVNAYRRREGLAPFAFYAAAAAAARGHSRAMAAGRVGFGHDGFRERAEAIGKRVALASMAENVSRHRRRAIEEIPEAALRRWIASGAHRRNLRGDRGRSGVGAARAADGEIFLTQIFVEIRGDASARP